MLVSQRPQHVTRDKECYTAGKLSFASVKGWSSKRIIGKGAFGEVFAVATQGGFEVAVKAQKLTENTVSSILKEVEYLKLVQGHDNVIAFYDEKIKHGKKHTIMTELALCNFYRIVSKGGPMAPHMAKRFAKQLLDGVDHIHSCGIAHNDLKLENLLLGNDGFLKIADFGLALPYVDFEDRDDGYFEYSGFIGTKVTAAPEVVQGSSKFAPVKNDIWACGVIIMEFLTGRPGLWQQASLEDPAFQHFIEDRISPLTGQDDEFIRFILQIDPKKRPLIFRILKHSWFQNGSRKRSSSCSSSEDEDEIYAKKGRR
ncbi:hypothetical protein L596_016570 [Steinernema carpocapsae]|uniref:Protein kinase domain-containing protein n=1 Tax=Steinernema carpocapsae TaxID=34508 RepID=A0A4U5NID2_STECR|nr:hypothetical protein L596_016570 [Steinernema carpocapsae]